MSQSVKVRGAPQSVSLPTKMMSLQQAKKEMDLLRKRFNDELLQVLEDEQQKENMREMQI
jgi:hypothetical protein